MLPVFEQKETKITKFLVAFVSSLELIRGDCCPYA
jgi:hypothetical protein